MKLFYVFIHCVIPFHIIYIYIYPHRLFNGKISLIFIFPLNYLFLFSSQKQSKGKSFYKKQKKKNHEKSNIIDYCSHF